MMEWLLLGGWVIAAILVVAVVLCWPESRKK